MRTLLAALLALAAFPAVAAAAPEVTTGGVADVTQSSATLKGAVDPDGDPTVVYFRYGTSKEYTAQTPDFDVGSGSARQAVTAAATALPPFTRINYRLIGRRADGKLFRGKNQTFRTKRQPLGLTLAADPPSLAFGGDAVLSGTLSGTEASGQRVVLQADTFPFEGGFADAGNPQVIQEGGGFAFPGLAQGVNTQYRVLVPNKPEVVSPVVTVGVRVRVGTDLDRRRRHRYRFDGKLSPDVAGSVVNLQRRKNGRWRTIKSEVVGRRSGYEIRRLIRKRGTFRVQVTKVPDVYVENVGREIRIRPNRR